MDIRQPKNEEHLFSFCPSIKQWDIMGIYLVYDGDMMG